MCCIELGPRVIVRLKPLLMSLPEVFLDCLLVPELLGADPTREDSPIVPQSFSKVYLLVVAGPGVSFNRHFEFWAQNWAQNWAIFWAKFSTRAVQV